MVNPDARDVPKLREVVHKHNFTDDGIYAAYGAVEIPTDRQCNLPRLLRMTRNGTPLDTLLRLFHFGVPVRAEQARSALAPISLESAAEMGIIQPDFTTEVRPAVALLTYNKLLMATDIQRRSGRGGAEDFVMGLSASTVGMAHATIRRHSRRTLDLGTGAGLHALLAAPHSDKVYAVDRNARAVRFTAFNARVNRFDNLEAREGDAFDPVDGTRFDLVVGNLPFIMSPGVRFVYRDSPLPLDGFVRHIVRQAPRYLEEGGYAQFYCGWAQIAGESWQDRIVKCIEGSGCDAWIMTMKFSPPANYAEECIRDTQEDNPAVAEPTIQEWMDYYDSEKVESLITGLICLRRSDRSKPWVAFDESDTELEDPYGGAIEDIFRAQDFLSGLSNDTELLERKLRVTGKTALAQLSEWEPGRWKPMSAQIRQVEGLRHIGNIDNHAAYFLTLCTGERTIREMVTDFAQKLNAPPEKVATALVPLLKNLVSRGFLRPV